MNRITWTGFSKCPDRNQQQQGVLERIPITAQPIQLIVLGVDPAFSPDVTENGKILGYIGSCIQVQMNREVQIGSALRLDINDQLLLGEVLYCQQVTDHFVIGLHVAQRLANGEGLTRLAASLI